MKELFEARPAPRIGAGPWTVYHLNLVAPYSDLPWFKTYMAQSTERLRENLLKHGHVERRCDTCSRDTWLAGPIPLQLDHIDGNRMNCTEANLRLLCPTCHALTPTFSGRNHKSRIRDEDIIRAYDEVLEIRGSLPSIWSIYMHLGRVAGPRNNWARERVADVLGADRPLADRLPSQGGTGKFKIDWPSDEALADLLRVHSRVMVGEMLGVSDNAIKKRVRTRNIDEPAKVRIRPHARTPRELSEIEHGTLAGYRKEVRRKLPTCDLCRAANAQRAAARNKNAGNTSPTTRGGTARSSSLGS